MAKQPVRDPEPELDAAEPSQEEIAARAYELYCERGCEDGFADQDWTAAEQELRSRKGPND